MEKNRTGTITETATGTGTEKEREIAIITAAAGEQTCGNRQHKANKKL